MSTTIPGGDADATPKVQGAMPWLPAHDVFGPPPSSRTIFLLHGILGNRNNWRTFARKLQEAVLTWRTEAVLDKRMILARYLNIVELGPGVYGIAAAARYWFGKPAAWLSVREAAFLAALAPAPGTMSRRIAAAHGLDPATAERVEVTLRAMKRAGVIAAIPPRTPLAFRPGAL